MSALPLYRRVLGERFAQLCPQVQALHDTAADFRATGRCDIRRGTNWIARLLAFLGGMPPAGNDVPLKFSVEVNEGRERWTRDFGGHGFSSVLWNEGALLYERLGPTTFEFRLEVKDGALKMILQRGWLLRVLPMPRFCVPSMQTTEACTGADYSFDVSVSWPVIGLVVEYRGTLRV